MKTENKMGMNRTGKDMSPVDAQEMVSGVEQYCRHDEGDGEEIAQNRILFAEESANVGSIPLPGTLRGVASTGMQKLIGNNPELLINKLGERLAFERTGTRLYDALISKHSSASSDVVLPPLEELTRIREEEAEHFLAVAQVIREIGADPTAQTPDADVAGVASQGLLQVLTDPRTSFSQCLNTILIAELTDNDCWEVLIQLTEKAGLMDAADRFRTCLLEEENHLKLVRQWIKQSTIGDGSTKAA